MSESETTPPSDAAQPEATEATDWKAEARKWEARAKSNLSELEQSRSALSATEAAAQQAAKALEEREAELANISAVRTKEALLVDAGLPRDLAANVVGDDEDAWKASVERFVSLREGARNERLPDPAQSVEATVADPKQDAAAFFNALLRK